MTTPLVLHPMAPLAYSGSVMLTTAGADLPRHFGNILMISIGGSELPVVTMGFALTGILLGRYLTPKKDPPLSRSKDLVVTVILLLVAFAWVVDSQPRLILTTLLACGLGYAGFAAVELMGEETLNLIRRMFQAATGLLDRITKRSTK